MSTSAPAGEVAHREAVAEAMARLWGLLADEEGAWQIFFASLNTPRDLINIRMRMTQYLKVADERYALEMAIKRDKERTMNCNG